MTESNISITVFAPTNAAFDAANIPVGMDPDMLVGNHIVLGNVKESDLVVDRRFMNMEGLLLHSTTAAFPDTSLITSYDTQFISVSGINFAVELLIEIQDMSPQRLQVFNVQKAEMTNLFNGKKSGSIGGRGVSRMC